MSAVTARIAWLGLSFSVRGVDPAPDSFDSLSSRLDVGMPNVDACIQHCYLDHVILIELVAYCVFVNRPLCAQEMIGISASVTPTWSLYVSLFSLNVQDPFFEG